MTTIARMTGAADHNAEVRRAITAAVTKASAPIVAQAKALAATQTALSRQTDSLAAARQQAVTEAAKAKAPLPVIRVPDGIRRARSQAGIGECEGEGGLKLSEQQWSRLSTTTRMSIKMGVDNKTMPDFIAAGA